jgi:hypothetical protein
MQAVNRSSPPRHAGRDRRRQEGDDRGLKSDVALTAVRPRYWPPAARLAERAR